MPSQDFANLNAAIMHRVGRSQRGGKNSDHNQFVVYFIVLDNHFLLRRLVIFRSRVRVYVHINIYYHISASGNVKNEIMTKSLL